MNRIISQKPLITMILQCMHIQDAKKLCLALGLNLELAFLYGKFTLHSPTPSGNGRTEEAEHLQCQYLYDCLEEIFALADYDHQLISSLSLNQSFYTLWNAQQMFILAAGLGLIGYTHKLLNHPEVDPSYCCNFVVWIASFCENIGVLQLLLQDSRIDPSANDNNAFITASSNGALQVMQVLLTDPRVDPSARNNFAIVEACSCGEDEIAECLLQDPRVDSSASDNLAIRLASKNGHLKIVDRLLYELHLERDDFNLNSQNCYESVMNRLLQDVRVNDGQDGWCTFGTCAVRI